MIPDNYVLSEITEFLKLIFKFKVALSYYYFAIFSDVLVHCVPDSVSMFSAKEPGIEKKANRKILLRSQGEKVFFFKNWLKHHERY